MMIDRYTKAILTMIALCLLYLCMGRPGMAVPVAAQSGFQRVIVAGWADKAGNEIYLPSPVGGATIAPMPAAEPRNGYPPK
jgi:hypothetical protein